jgi:hypothetical protein
MYANPDGGILLYRYLNPYAYLPARPQTLSVHGLSPDQTVVVRKNVFRQFLEGDLAPVGHTRGLQTEYRS